MIDNIRLSEKAKQQLIIIKRKSGIENWNVLCRWALCLSLAEKSVPPFEDIQTDSSVEMTWKVFSGELSEMIMSLLIVRMKYDNIEINKINIDTFFKLHLHRGISYLSNNINGIDNFFILKHGV
ncbi:DNA sulfur modification protein DndE [Aeromonas veronii]|uniref:DNA sulfur modification protein DndE n=1 Tax=Aeromonas veronii TaxID=654 RepID=UPI00107A9B3F|nr:DNA sulfur modification protein DndE [Aeromonas veronii]MCF5856324.1 DNA sulfur modification protein DndE [Aeromonas veronii]